MTKQKTLLSHRRWEIAVLWIDMVNHWWCIVINTCSVLKITQLGLCLSVTKWWRFLPQHTGLVAGDAVGGGGGGGGGARLLPNFTAWDAKKIESSIKERCKHWNTGSRAWLKGGLKGECEGRSPRRTWVAMGRWKKKQLRKNRIRCVRQSGHIKLRTNWTKKA